MREIKVRGLSNGAWVYGFLTHGYGTGATLIAHSSGWSPSHGDPDGGDYTVMTPVDPESVGQFTGLKDKNGIEVFEGDILKMKSGKPFNVFYSEPDFCFLVWIPAFEEFEPLPFLKGYKNFEVIGNIHENPELLEQSDEN